MRKRNIFLVLIMIMGFSSLFICSNVAIDNPDYTETIPAGSYLYFNIGLDVGDILTIEFEVIAGGNKDIDLYIKNSDGYTVQDYGRVISGTIYFTAPYDDTFSIYFSNSFSTFTSKTVEINFDITYAKSISIYSPRSTDLFTNGYNQISWTTTGDISYIRIELYRGSSFLETIETLEYNDGSYSWYLSSSDLYGGSNYRIRLSDYYDDSVYVFSSYFTISITQESTHSFYIAPIVWVLLIIIISSISAVIGMVIFFIVRRKRKFSEDIVPIETQKVEQPKKEEIPKITYCSSCGVKILDATAEYCSSCGTSLK